ncbi:hypothetical protein KIPB_012516, partial [Kipferlia bialata]|eukprot:g12516.t1
MQRPLSVEEGVARSEVDRLLDEADNYYQGKIKELQAALTTETARGDREAQSLKALEDENAALTSQLRDTGMRQEQYKRDAEERQRALVAKETELMRVREAAAREKQQLEVTYNSHMMREIEKCKIHYKQTLSQERDALLAQIKEGTRARSVLERDLK